MSKPKHCKEHVCGRLVAEILRICRFADRASHPPCKKHCKFSVFMRNAAKRRFWDHTMGGGEPAGPGPVPYIYIYNCMCKHINMYLYIYIIYIGESPPGPTFSWQKSDFQRKNWNKFAMQKQTTYENRMTKCCHGLIDFTRLVSITLVDSPLTYRTLFVADTFCCVYMMHVSGNWGSPNLHIFKESLSLIPKVHQNMHVRKKSKILISRVHMYIYIYHTIYMYTVSICEYFYMVKTVKNHRRRVRAQKGAHRHRGWKSPTTIATPVTFVHNNYCTVIKLHV